MAVSSAVVKTVQTAGAAVSAFSALRPRDPIGDRRHPLAPAAFRVERSRIRHVRGSADQTALTVWFGTGPALPAPGSNGMSRAVLRAAAGIVCAAALGALTAVAAQREAERVHTAP